MAEGQPFKLLLRVVSHGIASDIYNSSFVVNGLLLCNALIWSCGLLLTSHL